MLIRRFILVPTFVACGFGLAACGNDDRTEAAPAQRIVVDDRSFDGLKNPSPLAEGVQRFGTPDELSGGSSSVDCHVAWRDIGVEALFLAWGSPSTIPPCDQGQPFTLAYARLTGRWKTDRGLAIGDPESRVTQLYANARRDTCGGPDGRGRPAWLLRSVADELGGPGAYLCTLGVEIKDGKVGALLLSSTAASD